eukprot:CAMPEP_0182458204 /NCGR_PEP_ID=MMETSP1319-20130603/3595_1 /TAXON_ID=172717 /ORGANISM="Bolidomonas pacifica, Strain RCC208" /LENGTH=78 /DNA_ID=CAMNT_0024656843 /DNA_START=202 /DNA_END=438 /DNA_ORIENTATION=-
MRPELRDLIVIQWNLMNKLEGRIDCLGAVLPQQAHEPFLRPLKALIALIPLIHPHVRVAELKHPVEYLLLGHLARFVV